jgi:hypothetical protein
MRSTRAGTRKAWGIDMNRANASARNPRWCDHGGIELAGFCAPEAGRGGTAFSASLILGVMWGSQPRALTYIRLVQEFPRADDPIVTVPAAHAYPAPEADPVVGAGATLARGTTLRQPSMKISGASGATSRISTCRRIMDIWSGSSTRLPPSTWSAPTNVDDRFPPAPASDRWGPLNMKLSFSCLGPSGAINR